MSYARFKASDLGQALAPILTNPQTIDEMEALSRKGRPAVEAIGAQVATLQPDIDDTGKQHVGRLVRDALAARGLKPVRSARVRPGNLFAWGAVYGPIVTRPAASSSSANLRDSASIEDFDTWIDEVRKLVAIAPRPLASVDEFLAERRADWGE